MTVESHTQDQVRRGRLKLLGLFAIAGVPVVMAMVMYFGQVGVPGGRTNQGELVLPPLDATAVLGLDTSLETEDPWTLLMVGEGVCDQGCQDALYKIQQVNIALGREADRVRHMWLTTDPNPETEQALQRKYPQLQVRAAAPDAVRDLLLPRSLSASGEAIYLIDPLGNLMMRYRLEQSGNDLLDDLKKLLRVSKIG